MNIQEAEIRIQKANKMALGYIELAIIDIQNGGNGDKMRKAAIEELNKASDDDVIDALYYQDMIEQRQLERMGYFDDE